MNKDIQFIVNYLEGKDELASFTASLLRDQQIEKALAQERIRQVKILKINGRELGNQVKTHKQLRPGFCKTVFEEDALDGPLFPAGIPNDFNETQWRVLLVCALNVTLETQLPQKHLYNQYENPLRATMQHRMVDTQPKQNILRYLTPENAARFGKYLHPHNGDKQLVFCCLAPTKIIKLFLRDDELDEEWYIKNNDSMFDACAVSDTLRVSKNLYSLFRKQHNYGDGDYYLNDNEWYEYPYAKVNSPELTPAIPTTLPDALVLESDHV